MTRTTLMLVTIAALVNGLLAGGNVDRLLVATPAWEVVGLNRWADFSRAADLGCGQVTLSWLSEARLWPCWPLLLLSWDSGGFRAAPSFPSDSRPR